MRYTRMGRVPAKRHVQFREDGNLLIEEVLGFEGFAATSRFSITCGRHAGCRTSVLSRRSIEEWVPDTHVHRLTNTRVVERGGDPMLGRHMLQYNSDVEMAICLPEHEADYFYRDGEGDEVIFVHEGDGVVETIFGDVPYRQHDYVVIPRGTTYRIRFDTEQRWLTFYTPGEIETPNRYRNRYGSCSSTRRSPSANSSRRELRKHRESGSTTSGCGSAAATRTTCSTTTRSTSSAGTATSTRTPSTSTTSSPKRGACTSRRPRTRFQGPDFVIYSLPADAQLGPQAIVAAVSPLQRADRGGHVLRRRRLRRAQGRRRRNFFTLHPCGLPHGPQPGRWRRRRRSRRTSSP